jgi:hypothetical protein
MSKKLDRLIDSAGDAYYAIQVCDCSEIEASSMQTNTNLLTIPCNPVLNLQLPGMSDGLPLPQLKN